MALVPFGRRKAAQVNRDSEVMTGTQRGRESHDASTGVAGQSKGLSEGDSWLATRSGAGAGKSGTPKNRLDPFERMERSRTS